MKLNKKNLSAFENHLIPEYDTESLKTGIVHIGVGGFHRAHQAVYTEKLLAMGKAHEWAICGAGLRPEDRHMKEVLVAQDFLYSLLELSDINEKECRIIGAIHEYYLAEDELETLLQKLSSPDTRIVSLTITEGGYCTDDSTGEFMYDSLLVQHDVNNPKTPKSVFGILTEALDRRRKAKIKPFTVLSCDNLPHNGRVAKNALVSFAALLDENLSEWIASEVSFPNSMVDRITPATSEDHKKQLLEQHGIEDQWPVVCEPFIQWVVEDDFCNGRPAWEEVGVQFTADVTPYEDMKIRLLNGSHLALTYLGTLMGYEFAHQTMEDSLLNQYVRSFMDNEVTPLLKEAPGIDFTAYKETLIERFSNPVIFDQLTRICSDGSSKFPKFIFPTLLGLIDKGMELHRSSLVVAAWAYYLRGKDENGNTYQILDPRLGELQSIVRNSQDLVKEFLGIHSIFGKTIPQSPQFVESFLQHIENFDTFGVRKTVELVLRQEQ